MFHQENQILFVSFLTENKFKLKINFLSKQNIKHHHKISNMSSVSHVESRNLLGGFYWDNDIAAA